MSFIRGVYESFGPQVFFDENDKDFRIRFWTFAKNFGFPELEKDLFEGVKSLTYFDTEKAEMLKRLLKGGEIELRDNHILCRVQPSLVNNIARAESLVKTVFHRAYSGQGFFRDMFLTVDYAIDPESLKVDLFDIDNAPECYLGLMPTQSNASLSDFTGVMDISFDAKIRLHRVFTATSLSKNRPSFVFIPDNMSLYSAVLAYLENPQGVLIDRDRNTCCLLPENTEENDAYFVREYFAENPLNVYCIAQTLRDFSRNKTMTSLLGSMPEFKCGRNRDCYRFRQEVAPANASLAFLFSNDVQIVFSGEQTRLSAINVLNTMTAFLSGKIKEARNVLTVGDLILPSSWYGDMFKKLGMNEIHVNFADISWSWISNCKYSKKDALRCLEEFCDLLEKLNQFLRNLYQAIVPLQQENLRTELADMMVRNIKLDPMSYAEHPSAVVRRYVQNLICGTF